MKPPLWPRFAVAMFEAEWIEDDNSPSGSGPGSTFAYSCEDATFKTPPLDLGQQSRLAADLEEFMQTWIEDNCPAEFFMKKGAN